MKEYDFVIIGGGCAGLSLAYELDIHNKLDDKKLAIVEPRDEYKRDKTWSFWKVNDHNFNDCVIKNWSNFTINAPGKTLHLNCDETPYQTINSEIFYKKIISNLKSNSNIHFFESIDGINTEKSLIFNSVPNKGDFNNKLWQHFFGIEIEIPVGIIEDSPASIVIGDSIFAAKSMPEEPLVSYFGNFTFLDSLLIKISVIK